MKIKRAWLLCIIILLAWAAWGSRANVEEDTEEVPGEASEKNVEEILKQCQEKNIDNLTISEDYPNQWAEDSDALIPFLDLFGEEAGAIMRRTAEEEDSYVSFLRLERIDGLDICSFAVRVSEEEQYHVMVRGEWEDTEISFQHMVIPSTGCHKVHGHSYGELSGYGILQVDLNFDGEKDLLIHEGSSWGSGGTWDNYRAAVWDKTAEEFIYYSSFPEQLVYLDFENERVIDYYRSEISCKGISEYGVVDGEYVRTRELIWKYHVETDTSTLSYYEMGVLVKQHDVSGLDRDEVAELYPDLDYWVYG